MSDANAQWFYLKGSEQSGPVVIDQIRALAASGQIDRNTLVWTQSMAGWLALGETELARQIGGGPPPMMPTAGAGQWSPPAAAPAAYGAAPAAYGAAPGTHGAGTAAYGAPVASPGFVDAIKICFAKYATFAGRATRPEFWFFYLFYMIVIVAAIAIDAAIISAGSSLAFVSTIATLALLLPTISVLVRRLHDTDRSGWYYWMALIPLVGIIILIVYLCQPGTPGRNKFG